MPVPRDELETKIENVTLSIETMERNGRDTTILEALQVELVDELMNMEMEKAMGHRIPVDETTIEVMNHAAHEMTMQNPKMTRAAACYWVLPPNFELVPGYQPKDITSLLYRTPAGTFVHLHIEPEPEDQAWFDREVNDDDGGDPAHLDRCYTCENFRPCHADPQ